ISLAEAHCKLCLRNHVLEEDAVIAVLLCENSVTLKHEHNIVKKVFKEVSAFLQGPLLSLFHLMQCFPATCKIWMVCTGETRPWMNFTRISCASFTPTHLEQTHTSQRSRTSPKTQNTVFESNEQYRWWPVSTRRVWTAWCPAAQTAKSFVAPETRSSVFALGFSPAPRSPLPGVLCRRARRPGAPWPAGALDDDRPDWGWSWDWTPGCHPPPHWSKYRCPF
ncbi:hypothetical protein INR49_014516, partial [Caranx melampygus]